MNNSKNTWILFLSLIVILQALVLLYVFGRGELRRAPAAQRREAPAGPEEEKKPGVVPERKPAAVGKEEPAVPARGRIVLILDDWGYNLRNRDFIVGNDFPVTLSVLPFKPYSQVVANLAHDKNKDVILHMPMEPYDKERYGLEEKMLSVGMSASDAVRLLDEAFVSVPFAKGMSNHMGSRATEDASLMRVVMARLKTRGLFFVDSLVTSKSVCHAVARDLGVAFLQRNVFIDNENDATAIRQRLIELAGKARSNGIAVGVGHDRPLTIRVLEEMIPELEREGFRFVGVSEALRERT